MVKVVVEVKSRWVAEELYKYIKNLVEDYEILEDLPLDEIKKIEVIG